MTAIGIKLPYTVAHSHGGINHPIGIPDSVCVGDDCIVPATHAERMIPLDCISGLPSPAPATAELVRLPSIGNVYLRVAGTMQSSPTHMERDAGIIFIESHQAGPT